MKPCILRSLILTTSILFTFKASAQKFPDYVVTIKGDTIRCAITHSIFKGLRYTTAKDNDPVDLDEYFREYYIAEEDFLHRRVHKKNGDWPFMEVLEDGKINLYGDIEYETGVGPSVIAVVGRGVTAGVTTARVAHSVWYVVKGNGALFKVDPSYFVDINFKPQEKRMADLGNMLEDNKDVYNKFITEDKFDRDAIRNIIHLYNTGRPFVKKITPPEKEDRSNDFNPSQN